jgi:hypothetical protein
MVDVEEVGEWVQSAIGLEIVVRPTRPDSLFYSWRLFCVSIIAFLIFCYPLKVWSRRPSTIDHRPWPSLPLPLRAVLAAAFWWI